MCHFPCKASRSYTRSYALGVLALLVSGGACAQTAYPEKAIRLVVGFPSGGPTDIAARLLGQKFADAWGKPVVIDNASGAAGSIGADRVAKATPDGYTLGLSSSAPLVTNPSLSKLAYDPVKDFAPVSQVSVSPYVLAVHNAVPAKSVKEFLALAKAQAGEFTFASAGSGSAPHLAAELFKSVAGIDIRHIPYKGTVAAIPDLLGGRVTMTFGNTVVVLPLAREDKLRVLAVTSLKRSPAAPELPTIAESGYAGFEVTVWLGLLAPAKTPPVIVRKLHLETVKTLALTDIRTKFFDLGFEVIGGTPDAFAGVIKSEIPKWAKVIKDAGIRAD